MPKLKICGLKRLVDISYCNPLPIDYVGFIVDYPKSQRSVNLSTLKDLSQAVDPKIQKVGVFVNYPLEIIADLLNEGVIDIAQLILSIYKISLTSPFGRPLPLVRLAT
ncbi:hypothetical protein ODY64_00510 [Aerococcus sp. JJEM-2022b]|uniref:phosphoribosylanthranilate isomerase n=1 Tax=Aerococcus mictus TaxID=2976810 RepID=UPI00227A0D05|nr:hypothetical protein [Aerococcus mictus]MCY3070038.1 hypothetical protein [Aerococcus mictus]